MNTKKSQKQADQASAVEPMEPMSVSEQMQEELEPILLDKDFGGPLPHDKPAVEIQKQKGRIKKFIEEFVNKR